MSPSTDTSAVLRVPRGGYRTRGDHQPNGVSQQGR